MNWFRMTITNYGLMKINEKMLTKAWIWANKHNL